MSFAEHGHLGGYIIGGDDATYYPDLWTWLVKEKGVSSVLDVGCGEGHSTRFFSQLGCEVSGIDGVDQAATWGSNAQFIKHDYTKGKLGLRAMGVVVDLVWSCEFVEHVEERYVPNFLETFVCANLVLITHADPGQQGYHHVNCQTPMYWQGVMAAVGYELVPSLTDEARAFAAKNANPYNHFARSGLAFVRNA